MKVNIPNHIRSRMSLMASHPLKVQNLKIV
jgi:hypothetical protein